MLYLAIAFGVFLFAVAMAFLTQSGKKGTLT